MRDADEHLHELGPEILKKGFPLSPVEGLVKGVKANLPSDGSRTLAVASAWAEQWHAEVNCHTHREAWDPSGAAATPALAVRRLTRQF
jgi:hypothetical protein